MKCKNLLIAFSLLASRECSGQLFSTSPPSSAFSERLEFNDQIGNYFATELYQFQDELHPGVDLEGEIEKSKVHVETCFLECEGGWRVLFTFPEKLTFDYEIDDEGLLLTFNQSIDTPDLIKAQEDLGYLVKKLTNGYNTLYLVPRRPLYFRVEEENEVFVLDLIPDHKTPFEPTKNLKGAYARLLAEERDYQPALNALQRLEEEYEGDKDIQILHATLENLLPRWKRSLNIFEDLNWRHPTDDDVRKFMWEVETPHSPYISVMRQTQQTIGLATVQLYQTQMEDITYSDPEKTWFWGGQYSLYSGHVVGIVNNKGENTWFRGRRSQGWAYIRRENDDGSHVTALAYGQEGALGVGGDVGFLVPSIQGTFNLSADWHRPYWAVYETLAFNGREDRIFLQINSVTNRYFNWGIQGGSHRVGITGTRNGFSSFLLGAQAFYNFVVPNPIIGVNYTLNAEYVFQRTERVNAEGVKYFPVPYTSFEDHALTGYVYYIWRERWNFAAFGGRVFNRLGISQPTVGVSFKYIKPNPCGWELDFSWARFPSTTNQGSTSNYLTATFVARF